MYMKLLVFGKILLLYYFLFESLVVSYDIGNYWRIRQGRGIAKVRQRFVSGNASKNTTHNFPWACLWQATGYLGVKDIIYTGQNKQSVNTAVKDYFGKPLMLSGECILADAWQNLSQL